MVVDFVMAGLSGPIRLAFMPPLLKAKLLDRGAESIPTTMINQVKDHHSREQHVCK
jgi:hypothetical protein